MEQSNRGNGAKIKDRDHSAKVPSSPSTMRKIKPRSPLVLAENVQEEDDEVPTLNLGATEKPSPTDYTRDSLMQENRLIMTVETLAFYQILWFCLWIATSSSPRKHKTRLINGKKEATSSLTTAKAIEFVDMEIQYVEKREKGIGHCYPWC